MVERRGAGELAEPRLRRPPAGIEAAPATQRSLERLSGQVLGHSSVSRQVEQEGVDRVEVLLGDLSEARLRHPHASYTAPAACGVTQACRPPATACPPNWLRSAAFTLAAKDSS